jgi:hypothetical protein
MGEVYPDVHTPRSAESGIEALDVICGGEEETTFGGGDTVERVEETAERKSAAVIWFIIVVIVIVIVAAGGLWLRSTGRVGVTRDTTGEGGVEILEEKDTPKGNGINSEMRVRQMKHYLDGTCPIRVVKVLSLMLRDIRKRRNQE